MNREQIEKWAREAGWSGIYTEWAEPTGKPDWSPVKRSMTVPVTAEQVEQFARLVHNAALEEAKAACEAEAHRLSGHPDYEGAGAVRRMADLIDALKKPQP